MRTSHRIYQLLFLVLICLLTSGCYEPASYSIIVDNQSSNALERVALSFTDDEGKSFEFEVTQIDPNKEKSISFVPQTLGKYYVPMEVKITITELEGQPREISLPIDDRVIDAVSPGGGKLILTYGADKAFVASGR